MMASVFFEKQHGRYRIRCEYQGVSYNRSLGKSGGRPEEDKREAEATLLRVEKTLGLLAEGFLSHARGHNRPRTIHHLRRERGRGGEATGGHNPRSTLRGCTAEHPGR